MLPSEKNPERYVKGFVVGVGDKNAAGGGAAAAAGGGPDAVRVQIWDTAGQEQYSSLLPMCVDFRPLFPAPFPAHLPPHQPPRQPEPAATILVTTRWPLALAQSCGMFLGSGVGQTRQPIGTSAPRRSVV